MCGIWGYSGEPNVDEVLNISRTADERGGHSWGVWGIDSNGKQFIYKALGRVDEDIIRLLCKKCYIAIGHSRLATQGKVTLKNAQPFIVNDFVFVHNGVVENYQAVCEGAGYKMHTDVDSEAVGLLYESGFEKHGLEGAVLGIKLGDWTVKKLLKAYSHKMSLHHKKLGKTDYYCSKEWRQRF